MTWLFFIPWWILAGGAAIIVLLVFNVFGWRNAIVAASALAAAVFLKRSRDKGYEARKAEEKKVYDELQGHYDEIERENIDPDTAYDKLRGVQSKPSPKLPKT